MHLRVPVLALMAALSVLTANAKSELQSYVEHCRLNDRLYGFSPQYGLGCYNTDQPSGQCSNYVVRFICPN